MNRIKDELLIVPVFLILMVLSSCKNQDGKNEMLSKSNKFVVKVMDTTLMKDNELEKQVVGGKRLLNGVLYTGFSVKYHDNKKLSEKIYYEEGKKEGVAKYWFDDGSLKKFKTFDNNTLNGESISYFKNGQKSKLKNYKNNKLHGVQKTWYRSGKLFKRQNHKEGREDGMQESWMENGKKFINYEARNGRIFGLKRTNLCFGLKNEEIKTNK